MNISFSTIAHNNAKEYLSRDCFKWLNDKQKAYILNNLGDIRVQDPMMYPNPKIEIHNKQSEHNKSIMDLV